MSLIRKPGRFWRNTSAQVALIASCLLVAILLGAGYTAERRLVGSLTAQAQSRAQETADELVDEFVREGYDGLRDSIMPRLHGGERRLRYAVVGPDGAILVGDPDLCRFVPACDAQPGERAGAGAGAIRPVVASRRIDLGDRSVLVVDELAFVRDIETIIGQAFWYAVAAAVLAGAASGYVLSRYLLAQVGAINLAAEAIVSGDLSRRIPTGGTGDEFEEMRRTLNRMLERIADLLRNVHQVSTDIAHDLRTPLSRLRHKLEAATSDAVTRETQQATLDAAVHDLDEVLETFSALLRIAQIESGERRSAFRALDLSTLLADITDTYGAVAEEGGRRFESRVAPGLRIVGDRELLVQMLCNVIENALVHTPPGSLVELAAHRMDDGLCIVVSDDGEGISPSDRPLVFRRFYRGERSRSTPGTGLGLSLVAAIVELHGGTIALADAGPGLRLTMDLPGEAPAEPAATASPAGTRSRPDPQERIQAPAE